MSTKTLLKRVALGAAVAVSAGTLSLVSTTSAHAALTAPTTYFTTQDGAINIQTASSLGLLGSSLTTAGTGTAGASGSTPDLTAATVLSSGNIVFTTGNLSVNSGGYYTVSAGGYFSSDVRGSTSTPGNIAGNQLSDSATAAAGTSGTLTVSISGAAGSTFTITGWKNSAASYPTATLVVTIAGSSVAGVPSAAKSNIYWAGAPNTGQNLTSDLSTGSATTTGFPLYLQIQLKDAYGNNVTSTTGALTVTATTGANVGLEGTGTYSTAVSATSPADRMAYITEATAGAGFSGTVTVSYNGVVIATKSGTISGLPAKLVGSALVVGHTNSTVDTAIAYQVYDAAGNVVPVAPASIALSSSDNTLAVTGIAAASGGATFASNSSSSSGYLKVTGGTTAGKANLVLKTTLSNGAVISSNSFSVLVGGASASYTVSFDKSSYNQGDIATLTVKFLDSKGNAAASDSVNYSVASATSGWNASLSTPMLTQVGGTGGAGTTAGYTTAAPVVSNANGVIIIKYTVGTSSGVTAGAYNAIVDFPSVDAIAGSSQTVAYSVSTGGTSLNDVLKGIVSLIASINKQIAALAKLVSKK